MANIIKFHLMALISSKELTTTLSWTTRNLIQLRPKKTKSSKAGFTLLEILIVLSIVVLILSFGAPAIAKITYQRLNSTTRQFVGIFHTIRNDSILLNNMHRMVIDFEKQSWSVESQKGFKLLEDEVEKEKKKDKFKEPPPSNFVLSDKYSKKPNALPGGIVFDGVLTERYGFVNKGVVYIHFFPNGYTEQTIVYLNKEGVKEGGYSIVLRSTNGKVEVYKQHIASFEALDQ